jgi:hypothetical protein
MGSDLVYIRVSQPPVRGPAPVRINFDLSKIFSVRGLFMLVIGDPENKEITVIDE